MESEGRIKFIRVGGFLICGIGLRDERVKVEMGDSSVLYQGSTPIALADGHAPSTYESLKLETFDIFSTT